MSDREYLHAWEVAERLGVTVGWVWDKWEAGELPGRRLPGSNRLRFMWSEVEEVLERGRGGPDVAAAKQLRLAR